MLTFTNSTSQTVARSALATAGILNPAGVWCQYNTQMAYYDDGTNIIVSTGADPWTGSCWIFGGGTPSSGGTPGGVSGDIQMNNAGAFGVATGQDLINKVSPTNVQVVDGVKNKGIKSAFNACKAILGSSPGTCRIKVDKFPLTLNALPWPADHSENQNVELELGSGVLTLCSSSPDPDGTSCAAGFALATGTGGHIIGIGGKLPQNDTDTIIRAGDAFTVTAGTPPNPIGLVALGDSSNLQPNVYAFGATVENVTVDCNAVAGLNGFVNFNAGERSEIRNSLARNCSGASFWWSSMQSSNSGWYNVEAIPALGSSATTIPVIISSTTNPRLFNGITINGVQNANSSLNLNLNGATMTWSGSVGTITTTGTWNPATYRLSTTPTTAGPGGQGMFVYVDTGGGGWTGTWSVQSITNSGSACTTACNQITLGMPGSSPGNITGSSTNVLYIEPTMGALISSGNTGTYYSGDSATGFQVVAANGWHVQHTGTGVFITSTSGPPISPVSVVLDGFSCSQDVIVCVSVDNQQTVRFVIIRGLSAGGAATPLIDAITNRYNTSQYIAYYVTGNPANGVGGLSEWALPFVGIERSVITSQCQAGVSDCLWADNAAHRWKMVNNAGTATQVVASGQDIDVNDKVTKVNGTTVAAAPAANSVLGTSATSTGKWMAVPSCNGAGQALQYDTTNNAFGCVALSSSAAASDPPTCTQGQTYFNTTKLLSRTCVQTNTWRNSSPERHRFVFCAGAPCNGDTISINDLVTAAGNFVTATFSLVTAPSASLTVQCTLSGGGNLFTTPVQLNGVTTNNSVYDASSSLNTAAVAALSTINGCAMTGTTGQSIELNVIVQ